MANLYAFNKSDAKYLIGLIGNTGNPVTPNNGRPPVEIDIELAVATDGVPARSGTTLGKSTNVAVKYLVETAGNKVITDSGYTVTAYNLSTTAVGTGNYVLLSRVGDAWIVSWEDC
jgi:hypothetical protein